MFRLCSRLGLSDFEGISSEGMSGGLALFWDESVSVQVQEVNKRWIDVYVRVNLGLRTSISCGTLCVATMESVIFRG